MKRQAGFTLIELMIVIAIIGLLVAIVIPDLLMTRQQSEVEACKASLRGVQSALELYFTHYKYYPQTVNQLVVEGYLGEGSDKDPWNKDFMYKPDYGGGTGTDAGGLNGGLVCQRVKSADIGIADARRVLRVTGIGILRARSQSGGVRRERT